MGGFVPRDVLIQCAIIGVLAAIVIPINLYIGGFIFALLVIAFAFMATRAK